MNGPVGVDVQDGPARYDARSIAVLSGIEAVRLRPAMYVGSTGSDGVHQLLDEVVENAVDEAMAGHCNEIRVVLHSDGSCSVLDNGRGIPVDAHPSDGRPASEVVLTELHAGGKFTRSSYRRSGGLHGIGLSCVNALSDELTIDSWRDDQHYRQRFSRGEALGPLAAVGASRRRGTRVRFRPDPTIFRDACEFSFARTSARLRDLAFLQPGLHLSIEDERSGEREKHCDDRGLVGLVEHRNRDRQALHPSPISLEGSKNGVDVSVALQWTTGFHQDVSSFSNNIRTRQAGVHEEGLWKGLSHALSEFARGAGLLDGRDPFEHGDLREGLTAAVSVSLDAPEFAAQTKTQLVNPGVDQIVTEIVSHGLTELLAKERSIALSIVGRVIEAGRARTLARQAAQQARYREFDPQAARPIYEQQFGARSRNWHESCTWLTDTELLRRHAEMCVVDPSSRLLDVCCGSGIVGASFADRVAHTTGLDITSEMRELASARLDEVHEGNVYEIPFGRDEFDIVVTREVLHLLPQPERPLAEIYRVLRPGGQIVFGQTVPYGPADAAWMFRIFKKKQPLFFNNLLAEDYLELLRQAGFEDIRMSEHFLWESIDLWTDSYETPSFNRFEIKRIFMEAPAAVREIHPFEIRADGEVWDRWRWCIFSARKGACT